MPKYDSRLIWAFLGLGVMGLVGSASGCVQAVPQDVVEAVENIDRELLKLRADEVSSTDYTQFSHQWTTLKARAQTDEDLIRWPWEPNDLEVALRQLQEEGSRTVARITKERELRRRSVEDEIAQVENRFLTVTLQVSDIDSRLLLGDKTDEIELLMKQAHALYEQGQYVRSFVAPNRAVQNLTMQSAVLGSELGRYVDH
jgi:hypothetical protein